MSEISDVLNNLEITDDIFKKIKFFVSGDVKEKVIDLLKCGGAERMNYFSDYVTHLIVGDNPEENDIADANDLYEIPALTPKWVTMCVKLKKLVSTKAYLYSSPKLFQNLVFCLSKTGEDLRTLCAIITYNGGVVHLNFTAKCTHLVTTDITTPKYIKAERLGPERVQIVTPDWIIESVRNKGFVDANLFHPKLIEWPKVVKYESTTAITGFEPENTETEETTADKNALLEQLKQRMPWNQPPSTEASSMDTVPPPNVVAPSFLAKSQQNEQQQTITSTSQPSTPVPQSPVMTSFPNQIPQSPNRISLSQSPQQQIPSSIVHHTSQAATAQVPQSPLNINRLIGQPQIRPTLQQIRGQLGASQLHQQLLQQRISQNLIQRGTSGQISVQQQILQQQQQQLGQRQLINQQQQNQQMMQQQNQNIVHNPQLSQNAQIVQIQQQLQLKQNQGQQFLQNQQIQLNQTQQIQLNQNQQINQHILQNQQLRQNQLEQQQNQQQLVQGQVVQNQQQLVQGQVVQNQQQLVQGQVVQNQQQLVQGQVVQNQQQLVQGQVVQNQQQLVQGQVVQNQQQLVQGQVVQNQQQLVQGQVVQNQQQLVQGQVVQNQQQLVQGQVVQNQQQQQQQQVTQNQQQQVVQNQQITQSQLQLQQNQQQIHLAQNQQQMLQNQMVPKTQQIIQNHGQQMNEQIQLNQNKPFANINIGQHLISSQQNQILQQNKLFTQQAITSQQQNQQQQLIQNQPNLAIQQQQFNSTQNFPQNQQEINPQSHLQQQINQQLNQQQNLNQPNINQQLNRQNLGQQLNRQNLQQSLTQQNISDQLNQPQLNQLSQQLTQQNLGQQLNQQNLSQQINQQLNAPQVNQQNLNQVLNQQNLEQPQSINVQQISQQLNQQVQLNQQQQQQQLNPGITQQVIRTQFQPGNMVNQQLLLNQQNQQGQQRPHIWQQQQPQQQGQQQMVRHPVNVVQQGPRIQWSPSQQQGNVVPQRQFIQLDAQTHNQLQKMAPEQQALFVARLQKSRLLKQVQQRGGGSHILIRGAVPSGLTTQQQVQWLQQQAKQQGIVLPPNIQQQNITPGTLTQQQPSIVAQNIQQAPGLSPIQQNPTPAFTDQTQQQQLQLRQYRLQQLQMQREQAQKTQLAAAAQQGTIQPQPNIVRPIGQPQTADSTTNPPLQEGGSVQHPLVVNAKTKTALANMLSIRLQSGGSSIGPGQDPIPEPSAAGTLRLMTAQHNAALNSNNRSQDLITLQRRVINGPNGEIIRPPGATPVAVTPQSEPPKLQYCARPSVPLQHRPGPFYGHNPNLKLPPDLFLLGCIFVVVEIDRYLDDSLPGWQQKIEKHGGEVEKQYCNRVTHVLCETQRHGVVMQALRDCKRCVTIYWLSDVIGRKQVLPPWTALHLPTIYLDTTPASKHLISISGFTGSERNRVKHMITYTGAKFTSYFSKHNTLLITTKAEGPKFTYAKKWNIPVVNVQWLTDIMLGNFTALNQMEHTMYQQYPNPPSFSFDPKLVPNLMHAWKMPINISQESYERVKRSSSPVVMPKKPKRIKTEHTDENDNVNDQFVSQTHRILFSTVSNVEEMKKIIRVLGGSLAKSHIDCTHLLMPTLTRTNKLLFCVAKGAHIVSEQWLKDSQANNKFLPESNYLLDTKEFNTEYRCDFTQTLQMKNRNKLLEGKSFWITPSVYPSQKVLAELIQTCGGVVERIRRTAAQIEATNINSPYSYLIITHEKDIHLVADLLKNKKDKIKIICCAEVIFSAILKQTFEVDPHIVKVI